VLAPSGIEVPYSVEDEGPVSTADGLGCPRYRLVAASGSRSGSQRQDGLGETSRYIQASPHTPPISEQGQRRQHVQPLEQHAKPLDSLGRTFALAGSSAGKNPQ